MVLKKFIVAAYLLAVSCVIYAVDEFDIQVCEAQAEDASKNECYRGLKIDSSCDNLESTAQLPCYRKSAEVLQSAILDRKRLERERVAKEEAEREKARKSAATQEQNSKKQVPDYRSQPPESNSIPMSFQDCLSRKTQVIASLGVNPRHIIPIVNTGIMTMDRICTSDGSVLITCSKPDRKMIVTKSAATADVGCR